VAAHKKLCAWSTTKGGNKQHKAVKTRFVFDIKKDAEGQKTRFKARLVAQGFNQIPGRDFDKTWAPACTQHGDVTGPVRRGSSQRVGGPPL